MAGDIDFDELARYVAYLQQQLATPGTEAWFDHERIREWVKLRKDTLGESIPAESRAELVEEYVQAIDAFKPTGPYDSASARAIFEPLMDRVVEAAKAAGFRTSRAVTLHVSPAIEATPYTISTDAAHVIFAGPGTYMFCNYWGKIFTSLITGTPVAKRGRASLPLTLQAIAQASKLGTYYALTGTVMGFGVMPSDPRALQFRGEYVQSMELFALGHELGHCFAHDADERFCGMLTVDVNQELELLCDRIGTATSRAASTDGDEASWVAFCGAGAVLMMYAHEICQRARGHVGGASADAAHSYPSTSARVAVVREQVVSTTPDDQLEGATAYLDDVIALCEDLTDAASDVMARVLPGSDVTR